MLDLFIFEGPDRVGKSTLAGHVADQLGATLLHFGAPDPTLVQSQGPQYQYLGLLGATKSVVLDRSWVSGLFYEVVRRDSPAQWESALELHQALSTNFRLRYYYLDRPWTNQLEQDHQTEIGLGEGYGDLETRRKEHHLFSGFVRSLASTPMRHTILHNDSLKSLIGGFQSGPRQFDSALVRPAESLSKTGGGDDLWAQQPWRDHDQD